MKGIVYNNNARFEISRGRFRYRCNATQYAVSVVVAIVAIIIMNEYPFGTTMDAQRYDRNADQLSQIYWHLNRKNSPTVPRAEEIKATMMAMVEKLLILNDELGQMAEKGLI